MRHSSVMRAAVFHGPGDTVVETIDRFEPGPGEIVVRMRTTAVCTTERRIHSGELQLPYPVIGGHESAGTVEWLGDAQEHIQPGDTVILDSMDRCGTCFYCVKGQSNLCQNLRAFRGKYLILGGGFAEYVVVPPKCVFKISAQIPHEEACLAEPVACCLRSVNAAQIAPGESVLVLGAGTMGAIHLMLAKLRGARTMICDPDPQRSRLASDLGADRAITGDVVKSVQELTDGRGADVVFVTASSRQAGEDSLSAIGKGGRIILYASTYPSAQLPLDWNKVHYGELVLRGSEAKTPEDLTEAAHLLSSKQVNVRPLVSRVISLDELPEELGRKPTGEVQRAIVRLS